MSIERVHVQFPFPRESLPTLVQIMSGSGHVSRACSPLGTTGRWALLILFFLPLHSWPVRALGPATPG